jgi:hypothetical protein
MLFERAAVEIIRHPSPCIEAPGLAAATRRHFPRRSYPTWACTSLPNDQIVIMPPAEVPDCSVIWCIQPVSQIEQF